jgi:hypothetical protein
MTVHARVLRARATTAGDDLYPMDINDLLASLVHIGSVIDQPKRLQEQP